METIPQNSEVQQEESLSGHWFALSRSLRKRLPMIRVFTGITVAVVVLGTWLQSPVYRATSTVLIDLETPSVVSVSGFKDDATVSTTNYMAYADYYRTQLEALSSRSIAQLVFDNLKMAQHPRYRKTKDPVGKLLKQIEIEPVKQTRIAKIHVEDSNPKQAARIANELALVFTSENLNRASLAESMILAKTEYLELQRKETQLSKRYKDQHPALVRVRKEMEQLAQEIEEGMHPVEKATTNLRPNNIRIQDLAQVPERPIRPKRLLSLLLGILFGVLGGSVLAVGLEMMDTSLKTPEDIGQGSLGVLLGHVPAIDGAQGPPSLEYRRHMQFAHVEAFSPAAEAYRAIRTTLLHTGMLDNAKTVIFTSPGPEEGKSTTVSNLGVAIAQSGTKLLLVDADMRRGRLHEVFSVKRSPGLSEYLSGEATLEQVIQPTEVENLHLVSSGKVPLYPAELVSTDKMKKFIEQSAKAADLVFIDTPPVMAVTDAAVIAALAKNVVAVVQSGKTPRQALERLFKVCADVRAKVLGVILNNVPIWSTPYYYRYSSYSYTPSRSAEKIDETPL